MVKVTFNKYNKFRTQGGRTAAEIAREALDENGLFQVAVTECAGELTDHYDPRTETVALSQAVYSKDSVGAISVALHEVGHAVQHAERYLPVKMRQAIFPVVNICSKGWGFVLIAGILLEWLQLIWIAIILFGAVVVFKFITLPVEFDASNRAIRMINDKGYLVGEEITWAKKTLTAAALTYLASLIVMVMQMLRLIMRTRRR